MASSSRESDSEGGSSSQPLGQRIASGLVRSLTGTDGSVPPAEQSNLLQRQNTAEQNRTRVRENQRAVASQMMMASVGCVCFVGILLAAYCITSFVMYFWGWYTFAHSTKEECDVPLKWWLLVVLVLPCISCQTSTNEERNQIAVSLLRMMITPIALIVGVYLYHHSTTCKETNPTLYHFTKMYLIWYATSWLIGIAILGGMVSVVLTLHRMGLLAQGPGPHMAARSGLIDDIETVVFRPSDFCESGSDGKEPPECAICMVAYEDGESIKKTPCGHFFHEECLGKWLENAKSCPLCRKDLQGAIDHEGTNAEAE